MNTSTPRQVRDLNKSLTRRAFENYRGLISQLCLTHSELPYAATIDSLIRAEQVDKLVELADSLSAQQYADAAQHFAANQFAALIRKYPFPPGSHSFDPAEQAYRTFCRSEHKCARINSWFEAWSVRKHKPRPYDEMFRRMEGFVRYVISDAPPLESIFSKCNFGPGASLGVHGNATNLGRKLLAQSWTVSSSAYSYAYIALMNHAQFREVLIPEHAGFTSGEADYTTEKRVFAERVSFTNHNNITFVPKTVKTLRSIAVEPLLNGYLQKGIDQVLRDRLRRIGVNLSDQDPNRQFSRLGSFDEDDAFVTIDLSSASDSISTGLCQRLLPPEWFAFLNACRSKHYKYKGVLHPFHKFCSMGNGFCFPLETLIFTAACSAVNAGTPGVDYLVYGDDIIVRKTHAADLIALLNVMGFSVNKDKTFLQGPFRESCGADWYLGEDVRPFTLDFALDDLTALYKVLNLSNRNARSREFFWEVRPFLLRMIPHKLQFWRPFAGNVDSAIDSTGDEHLLSHSCKYNKSTRSWRWKELLNISVPDSAWDTYQGRSACAALVYAALSGSDSKAPFTYRGKTRTKVRVISHSGATSTWLPALYSR